MNFILNLHKEFHIINAMLRLVNTARLAKHFLI